MSTNSDSKPQESTRSRTGDIATGRSSGSDHALHNSVYGGNHEAVRQSFAALRQQSNPNQQHVMSDGGGAYPPPLQLTDNSKTGNSTAAPKKAGVPGEIPADQINRTINDVKITGYTPGKGNTKMEGGSYDAEDRRVCTEKDQIEGKCDYTTLAGDKYNHVKDGQLYRIPEREQALGKVMNYRMMDRGDAFSHKGDSGVDIAERSAREASDITDKHPNATLVEMKESDADRLAALAKAQTSSGRPDTKDHGYRDEETAARENALAERRARQGRKQGDR
jgi:hypothetical protein